MVYDIEYGNILYDDISPQEKIPIENENYNNDFHIIANYLNSFTDQFKFNFLEEYVLLNRYEVKKFILLNDDLIELFQEINILRNKYFNSYPCSLEFVQDPEFTSLDQLVIYIHGAESSFDEDWETLKLLNKDIRMLNISNNSIKNLVSVDLW